MTASAIGTPLKIGVLCSSLSRNAGGLFESVRNLSLSLHHQGIEVSVFGVRDRYTDDDLGAWRPLVPHVFPVRGPSGFGYAPNLLKALLNADIDALHLHGLWNYTSIAARRWHQVTGKPLFVSPRGMLDSWALSQSSLKKKLAFHVYEKRSLKAASFIHALNESEADAIRAVLPQAQVLILPNAITPPETAPVRQMSGSPQTLLFLGRIHPKKGVSELLKAWALAQDIAPEFIAGWQLKIAGWGDAGHVQSLDNEIAALSLQNSVEFVGPAHGTRKDELFRSADAFILPSHSEGLPMAVLEAWGYALPVLMTQACNLEIGFSENAGLRISQEPAQLAQEICQHLGRPDLTEIGANGRNLVLDKFTWPDVARDMGNAYRTAQLTTLR